jgi:acyl-CoA thioesterase FadM
MSHVHADTVSVRHDELDGFGMVRASAALRWLAQLAADASAAAGFGPEWYDAQGLMWLIRRTMLDFERPMRRGERLALRTWVEDFRRVRSHRAYEMRDAAGGLVGRGRTDWVLIDTTSGRPVRVPAAVAEAFGVPSDRAAAERPAWQAPAPPAVPSRMQHEVRFADLDSLAHVNNAAYLDLLADGALGAFAGAGWGPDRLRERSVAPWVRRIDVEYLDAAVWGDRLTSTTWMAAAASDLAVFQLLARTTDVTPLVRARADWAWRTAAGAPLPAPPGLVDGLGPLVASA